MEALRALAAAARVAERGGVSHPTADPWAAAGRRADILAPVTTQTVPSRRSTFVRRSLVVLLASTALLAIAGPASADVPVGWSDPEAVSAWEVVLILLLLPIGMALVITLLCYLPAIIRGERLAPGGPQVQNQWIGGPRQGTAELSAPEGEDSETGGASGRW